MSMAGIQGGLRLSHDDFSGTFVRSPSIKKNALCAGSNGGGEHRATIAS